ncbi:MAG TPA: M1 family aminopeptidase [Chitinophagaceae bacterium]|nr:M1 family aminopeptidase [Chitinophagaceae bacterium]
MKIILLIASLFITIGALPQAGVIDVQHYRFELGLFDSTDEIKGRAFITVRFMQPVGAISFDLQNVDTSDKGMVAQRAQENGQALQHRHNGNKITLQLGAPAKQGEVRTFEIVYSGIPKDGLIISKNKFGQRTFFGDNWPDRAKNWLPCIDDPADKASVEFVVTAPLKYQVVSNGLQMEETVLAGSNKLTHWKETVPLATKIMVIGVAEFAVQYVGDTLNVPIYSWVYTQDKDKAFYDYALAKDIIPYFSKNIAPYPYRKLANVQSTTIFGGMENAGCIFYTETAVSGKRRSEDLLTHEIAHQWFGNMVTETSFAHLWLSEGFATYFTDLYLGLKYGLDSMNKRLRNERNNVIGFNRRSARPVVDTFTKDYMQLLNANSYQKGAWVLHMLKTELGEEVFMKGIRAFYNKYAGGNANTEHFRKVMEEASGRNLQAFFRQWLYTPGHPVLKLTYEHNARNNTVTLTVSQQQPTVFTFPLEIELVTDKGPVRKTLQVNGKEQRFTIANISVPRSIVPDPGVKLLFESAR